jgi:hypothetical protein
MAPMGVIVAGTRPAGRSFRPDHLSFPSHTLPKRPEMHDKHEILWGISNTARIERDEAPQGNNFSPEPAESKMAETGKQMGGTTPPGGHCK